ncbi:MAG: transcriptional repressor [Actinobacteria bacterium]|nr:MAG: transcriptional repressor [Actinomycetota bacterium]
MRRGYRPRSRSGCPPCGTCKSSRCTCNELLHSPSVERAPNDFASVMTLLREQGLRMTPQRRAIVSEVMRTQGHISPAQMARTIQGEMPGVNASTIYRTLTLLEEVGVLQHSHLESGAEYHKTDEAQHVHLTCSRCGRDDALSLREADKLGSLIHAHHGFVADLTHFAITGLCADCARS